MDEARKALSEGREPPLPVLSLPQEAQEEITRDSQLFGVNNDEVSAIPAHLRTSSTQAEPATPPKWMTYEEAEEKVKQANAWVDGNGPRLKVKKERPTGKCLICQLDKADIAVSHVLKLFGTDKTSGRKHP